MANRWASCGTRRIAWTRPLPSSPAQTKFPFKVTNAWVNRLIGDEQPNAVKITFADVHPYKADSPLLPSGLLGPVTLHSITTK